MTNNPSNQFDVAETEERDFLSEFDLDKLLFVLKKSLFWIVLFLAFCVSGSYLFLRYTQSIYEASTVIKLEVKQDSRLIGIDFNVTSSDGQNSLASEIEIIKSEIIYQGVVRKLQLDVAYFAEGEILSSELFGSNPFVVEYDMESGSPFYDKKISLVFENPTTVQISFQEGGQTVYQSHKIGEQISLAGLNMRIFTKSGYDPTADLSRKFFFIIHSRRWLNGYLARNLTVGVENPRANSLRISFQDSHKTKAEAILAAVNEMYKEASIASKNLVFEQSLDYLSRQLLVTEDTLDNFEERIQRLTKIQAIPEFDGLRDIIERVRALDAETRNLNYKLEHYGTLADMIEADSSDIYLVGMASIIGDQQMLSRLQKLGEVRAEFERSEIGGYKNSLAAFKQKLNSLGTQKEEIFNLIEIKKSFIKRQIFDIRIQLAKLENDFYNYELENPELRKYRKNMDRYNSYVEKILDKIIEIEIAKAGTTPNFKLLSAPYAAPEPVYPEKIKVYAAGAAAWVFFSFLLIGVRYLLQNKINSLKQLERILRVPMLGVVPSYRGEGMDFSKLVIHQNPKASISESFRSIRTNLDFMSAADGCKTISVTSTVSGEGKTFVTINLAGVIALSGLKVVILDLDLRKPKINVAFDSSNLIGMSSLLIGKATIAETLHDSPIPSLKFITAGPIPPNPSELMMSDHFGKIIKELKEQFDVILMDTPPVGLVTDGVIAMKKSDISLYVLRAEYSKLEFSYNVNRLMAEKRFKNMAAILNDAKATGTYGYNYSYGYNSYGYSLGGYGSNGYYDEELPEKKTLLQRIFKR